MLAAELSADSSRLLARAGPQYIYRRAYPGADCGKPTPCWAMSPAMLPWFAAALRPRPSLRLAVTPAPPASGSIPVSNASRAIRGVDGHVWRSLPSGPDAKKATPGRHADRSKSVAVLAFLRNKSDRSGERAVFSDGLSEDLIGGAWGGCRGLTVTGWTSSLFFEKNKNLPTAEGNWEAARRSPMWCVGECV